MKMNLQAVCSRAGARYRNLSAKVTFLCIAYAGSGDVRGVYCGCSSVGRAPAFQAGGE